jgi:pilus assembly protein CpaE
MATHGDIMLLAVMRSAETESQLTEALHGYNGTKLDIRVGALKALAPDLARERPDLLFVDVDVDDPEDMEALNRITVGAAGSGTPILATSSRLTPSAVRRLLRDGIADFVPQPLARVDLIEAINGALGRRSQASAPEPGGAVITFLHACGGVGASTLAVNTAAALVHPKWRVTHKVCLIDLDVQFGSAALYLDLEPGMQLVQMAREPDRLDPELLRGALIHHRSGIEVLSGPPSPMPLESLRPQLVGALLDHARREFDFTVIDLPQALTSWTETVLTRSDLIFVVTQLNVAAVRQTHRLLTALQEEGFYQLPVKLVLNRYEGGLLTGHPVRRRQAEKALGRPFDYYVPNAYEMIIDALNQGRTVLELRPRTKYCRQLRKMLEHALPKGRLAAPGVRATA